MLITNGGTLAAVPPANTSRRCSSCRRIDKASRLSQAMFVCTTCGHLMNADTNAAKNILAIGYALTRATGPVAVKARVGDANRQPTSGVHRAPRPESRYFSAGQSQRCFRSTAAEYLATPAGLRDKEPHW